MADDGGITLRDLFSAVNRKDTHWWETLSPEQQRKFSSWLYTRYMSVAKHRDPDMNRYYLLATNKIVNRHSGKLAKNHAKLLYLLMTATVFEGGAVDHVYVPPLPKNKKNKAINTRAKILSDLNPAAKDDDLLTLAELMTDRDFEELLTGHGWDPKKIKAELKK